MLKFMSNPNVPGFRVRRPDDPPGFRVGFPDDPPGFRVRQPDDPPGAGRSDDPLGSHTDENRSARAVWPDAPSAPALRTFTPGDTLYQGDAGLFPARPRVYVPVSGGLPPQDPLRQAVDRANVPVSGGLPSQDPLRQAVDRATNYSADSGGNQNRALDDDVGPPVGGLTLGALGAALGSPVPGLGFLLAYGGYNLGNALQRLHHRGMLEMGNGPSLGVNPVGP
jgi:hypothetical protein